MLTQKLKKTESLSSQIEKMSQEHALLKESLYVEITKLLNQKNAMRHDFETLVGGIICVIDTLKKDDKDSTHQKQNWKKAGAGYFGPRKKSKASIETNAA